MQPMSPTAMKTLRENKYAITQECLVPSLVEINSVVLEKNISNFINCFHSI